MYLSAMTAKVVLASSACGNDRMDDARNLFAGLCDVAKW